MATLFVVQKPMLAVYPPATLTAWYYAVGTVFTMVLCACSGVQLEDFRLTGQIEVSFLVTEAFVVFTFLFFSMCILMLPNQ